MSDDPRWPDLLAGAVGWTTVRLMDGTEYAWPNEDPHHRFDSHPGGIGIRYDGPNQNGHKVQTLLVIPIEHVAWWRVR